jgi:ribonuclease HII
MKKRTIKEIKEILKDMKDEQDPVFSEFMLDERKGVQTAVLSWQKQREKEQLLLREYNERSKFEESATAQGFTAIAGIDEVGRGPLAGPVVAAAVILPENKKIIGLNDSKKLSLKKREELYEEIYQKARAVSVAEVSASEIDRINIYQASKNAMKEAVAGLEITPDYLLIDAMELEVPIAQEKLIKGDARSVSIAAASIIAKVTRDRLMEKYDQMYPGYGFKNNAGYGTKEHLDGLTRLGVTPIHRRSFSPVKNVL